MEWIVVALAGFFGGMLNAVAGGGSFFTLPALIFVGVPPVLANATGTAALLPGYIASAWRFRHDIELPKGLNYKIIFSIAIMGGGFGAFILLVTDEQLFSSLIPWLILFATVAFIVGPWILKAKKSKGDLCLKPSKIQIILSSALLLAVCIYGGYFNGGLGIILLSAFGLMGQSNLHGMNGLKNVVSALLTVVAVVVYAVGGTIVIEYLLVLGCMSLLGGYFGATVAYRIPQNVLRGFIVLVGSFMSITFFMS